MIMQHISLNALLKDAGNYHQMPIAFQQVLKRSVWLTLITEVILLVIFIAVPHQTFFIQIQHGGFWLIGADLINGIFRFAYTLLPYLALLNLANLFLTLCVMTISLGTLFPIRIRYHWLAMANAFPTGGTVISVSIIAILVGVAIFINLMIWLVIICMAFGIIVTILSGGGQ